MSKSKKSKQREVVGGTLTIAAPSGGSGALTITETHYVAEAPRPSKFVVILSDGTYLADENNFDAPRFFETESLALKALEALIDGGDVYDEDGLEILEVVNRKIARKTVRVVLDLEALPL